LEPNYFWIDALSIDQRNVLERNHQVQMMTSIYSQAQSVRVWLGLECYPAFEVLHRQLPGSVDLFSSIYTARYWTRVWTVQEFEVAKAVDFMAGDIAIGLEALISKLDAKHDLHCMMRAKGNNGRYANPAPHRYVPPFKYSVMDRLRNRGQHKNLSLQVLVQNFSELESNDPRDGVFGLLGLARRPHGAGNAIQLEADYSMTATQVYDCLEKMGLPYWACPASLRNAAAAERVAQHSDLLM
jgi:hypothetical protein